MYNGHGDVVLIVDALNQALNTYEYDAFGNVTNETETLDNPYKYAEYYYDSETGNYYLMSRYYNPAIARFISEDTYRGETNDPLSLNRYVYVNNNPLIYYDPNGNAYIPIITGIIGGIFGGGTTFVQDWLDDGKINTDWKVYVGNTAQGAITGAALGFGINPFVSGFAGGTIGDVTNQLITTGQIDVAQSLVSGATTSITSGVFSLGGKVTSTGLNYVKDYAAKGFLAGMAGDSTYQILNGGIVRDEYGKATGYNLSNAIQGYNPVQALKSGVAGAIMAPIGAKIVETAIDKWGSQKNPLENVEYTYKVKNQMTWKEYHGFPDTVDSFGADGIQTKFTGGDGITRTKIQIPGGYKGENGVFEYIIEPDGSSNHRVFVPNK